MLDISTLRVNDRVRLLRPVSGHDPGTEGTVVRVLQAHEHGGEEVPAVIVAWHSPGGPSPRGDSEDWDGFTQHEQAVHAILERVVQPQPVRARAPETGRDLR